METTDEKNPATAPANNPAGHADTAHTPALHPNHNPSPDAPHLSNDPQPSPSEAPGIPVGSLSFLSNIQPDFWD